MARLPDDKILYLIKSRGPLRARDIAQLCGVTTPAAQQRLARLAEDGLAAPEDRRQPRGRPHRYWRLTEQGHQRFPDRHADLTLELIDAARSAFGEAGVDRLIAHRETAARAAYDAALSGHGALAEKVAALAERRTREGYMAEAREVAPGRFLLVENHCPICAAASVCQGFCRSELALFRAVLGPEVSVTRTDHILAGARRCAYEIIERSPSDAPGRR